MTKLRSLLLVTFVLASTTGWSAVEVGTGGGFSLGDGQLDLAGGDLRVDGQFDVGGGIIQNVGSIVINGDLDGGTGLIEAWGDWINLGSFAAGSGDVHLLDTSGQASQILGETTFANLSLTSTAGGRFVLESGQEQRVLGTLTILGLDGTPIQMESDSPPQPAFLWLDPASTQVIDNVGVSNVHATGQHLAPDQTNQGGSGNDLGWFGRGFEAIPVPTLSIIGLLLLMLTVLFFGNARQYRRRG